MGEDYDFEDWDGPGTVNPFEQLGDGSGSNSDADME